MSATVGFAAPDTEVFEWRVEQLRRAGVPEDAILLDEVPWLDVAAVRALVERGCPPVTALEIVR